MEKDYEKIAKELEARSNFLKLNSTLHNQGPEDIVFAIAQFIKIIGRAGEQTNRYTQGIIALTIVMLLAVIYQIYLALPSRDIALDELNRNKRSATEFCKSNQNGQWPTVDGAMLPCVEVLKMVQK